MKMPHKQAIVPTVRPNTSTCKERLKTPHKQAILPTARPNTSIPKERLEALQMRSLAAGGRAVGRETGLPNPEKHRGQLLGCYRASLRPSHLRPQSTENAIHRLVVHLGDALAGAVATNAIRTMTRFEWSSRAALHVITLPREVATAFA